MDERDALAVNEGPQARSEFPLVCIRVKCRCTTNLLQSADQASPVKGLATNAERDSIKYMQVKYMQDHKDLEFLGVISGVTEWGIYVEIVENKCEGMCRIREIKDDYYTFDDKQYALVGEISRNILQLGDEVIVKVKNADLVKKQLDFHFIRKNE